MLFAACASDREENAIVELRPHAICLSSGEPCHIRLPSASQKVRELFNFRDIEFDDVNIRGNPAFVSLTTTADGWLGDDTTDGTGQFLSVMQPELNGSHPVELRTCGWTPLHTACAAGNVEVVKVLLEYGADPTMVDNSDEPHKPMDVAIAMHHFDIVKLLQSKKERRARIWYGGVIGGVIAVICFGAVFITWIPFKTIIISMRKTYRSWCTTLQMLFSNITLSAFLLSVCIVVTGIIIGHLWNSHEADARQREAIEQLLKEDAASTGKKKKATKKIKVTKQPSEGEKPATPAQADEQPPVAMMENLATKEADTALQAALEADLGFLMTAINTHAAHATPAVLTAATEARQRRVNQALQVAIGQQDLAGIISVLQEYAKHGSQEVVDKARKARDEIKKNKKKEEMAAREAAEKIKRQVRIDALLKEVSFEQAEAALEAAQGIEEAPNEYLCPVTQELMTDPVIATDGHTYERSEIARWFKQNLTSPKTLEILPSPALIPNHQLRSLIIDWKEKHGR